MSKNILFVQTYLLRIKYFGKIWPISIVKRALAIKLTIALSTLGLQHLCFSQNFPDDSVRTLLDERDGVKYEIVRLNGLYWFKDNLKYETEKSHCPNFNKADIDCGHGNFYSYHELETICPKGWRVANTTDWKNYFQLIQERKNIAAENIKIDTFPGQYLSIDFTDLTDQVQLFENGNPLNLAPWGWVEGRKIRDKKNITLWAKHPGFDDNRFHLHIGNQNFILHTHVHNIDDKPRKTRKFMVKCVCEAEEIKLD